ncbi:MAG: hypothetical protein AABX30_03465 [Nanoarchaeota archaeon]
MNATKTVDRLMVFESEIEGLLKGLEKKFVEGIFVRVYGLIADYGETIEGNEKEKENGRTTKFIGYHGRILNLKKQHFK